GIEVAMGERLRRERVDRGRDELEQRAELDGVVLVAEQRPLRGGQRLVRDPRLAQAMLLVELRHLDVGGAEGDPPRGGGGGGWWGGGPLRFRARRFRRRRVVGVMEEELGEPQPRRRLGGA